MSADNWTECYKCGGSFREDYEVGIWEGALHIDYGGHCQECGEHVTFKHEKPVSGPYAEARASALAKLTDAERKALKL